jgi:hypothetical protein
MKGWRTYLTKLYVKIKLDGLGINQSVGHLHILKASIGERESLLFTSISLSENSFFTSQKFEKVGSVSYSTHNLVFHGKFILLNDQFHHSWV